MGEGTYAEVKEIIYWFGHGGEPAEGAKHFVVGAQLQIGQPTDELGEVFELEVCSPSMLGERFDAANWIEQEVLADTRGNDAPMDRQAVMGLCSRRR